MIPEVPSPCTLDSDRKAKLYLAVISFIILASQMKGKYNFAFKFVGKIQSRQWPLYWLEKA